MEGPLSREKASQKFKGFDGVFEKFLHNELPFSEVEKLAGAKIVDNPNRWDSVTRGKSMEIGLQKVPSEVLRRWKWGTESAEQEYLVKLAHEISHVVQSAFNDSTLAHVDKRSGAQEEDKPFLELYDFIREKDGLYGLSQERVYAQQNLTTGNYDTITMEDISEAMGSYLLGLEYFAYRAMNTRQNLGEEEIETLALHLEKTLQVWKNKVSQS